jgi:glucose/arabinose dehydrogenase
LRGQRLWRLVLDPAGDIAQVEELLTGEYGRLRRVAQAPDGSLWLLTSNRDGRGAPAPGDDRILRLGA